MTPKSQVVSLRSKRVAREQERRERDILQVARDLLARDGLAGFSMETVADLAGYSRTAIYRYYPSKEELILALAVETAELRFRLWRPIETFEARPRERLVAMGEVTAILYPRHILPQAVALSNAVRGKTSAERRRTLRALDREDHRLALSIVRDAIEAGDLALPGGLTAEELLFGIDALVRGTVSSIASATPPADLGVPDPLRPMRVLGRELLDGIGWRPLSSEWDYGATMRRIYTELYAPEVLAPLGLAAARRESATPRGKKR
jgi:AcrR family transcriptional regulator